MATTIRTTALDFDNIKNNLKTFLANKEEFKDYNFEAAGLSNILDVLAHNTHMNALTANFALNESFLPTAQLRSSIVSLAEGLGYIPDTDTASQARLRIYFSSSVANRESIIPLPAYTKFTTTVDDISYTFLTTETYYATDDGTGYYEFLRADGSNQIPVYQGTLKKKTFLVGEYADNPVYIIPDGSLDADTVTVKVFNSTTSSQASTYQNIKNITSVSAESTVYILKETPNGYFELSFGDGTTFGKAPAAGAKIEVQYLSTKGEAANGATVFTPAQQLSQGNVTATLNVVTLQKSVGGGVKESIESIRKKAPYQYASQNRMVTAEDYSSLILRNYSTLIKDIVSWGGEDALQPEYGAVYTSILFENDVSQLTKDATKLQILELAKQLAIISWNIRFADPVTTYIEMDTFFQFNPKLTDLTLNAVQAEVRDTITNYFNNTIGKFKQSFRRSNVLTDVDDVSTAVLSSRADIRMQQRFTPSAPTLIGVINDICEAVLTDSQINQVVDLVVQRRYEEAANFLINNNLTSSNFTVVRAALSSTFVRVSQQLKFPVSIAIPDDNEYIINSNAFTYKGVQCVLKNKLSSNTIQIVNVAGGAVIVDSIGNYDPGTGTVTINYFQPTSIAAGATQIKLSAVPSNQSAIAPTRNYVLVYDPDRSSTTGVIVSATN